MLHLTGLSDFETLIPTKKKSRKVLWRREVGVVQFLCEARDDHRTFVGDVADGRERELLRQWRILTRSFVAGKAALVVDRRKRARGERDETVKGTAGGGRTKRSCARGQE